MLRFGAYTGDSDTAFKSLESSLGGYQLAVVQKYYNWGEDPSSFVSAAAPRPIMACLDMPGVSWSSIASGGQDSYINKMISVSKAAGRPTYWRIGAEMNGNWEVYYVNNSSAAASCKAAFQHIGSLFHAATPYAKLVFCANDSTSSGAPSPTTYYPGSSYVDIIGVDSYSWSGTAFDTFFAQYYSTYSGMDSNKEVWVCETGCQNTDANQGTWVSNAVKSTKFPNLTTIVYENSPGTAANPWTLTSSALSTLKATLGTNPPSPTKPSVPTNVKATAGNGQATVTWTASTGSPTSYTVTSSPGSLKANSTGTTATVSGLTNGTSYTFTVTATNSAGTSAASVPSNSVTPSGTPTGVPGVPTNVTAKPGNRQASVKWTAPTSGGTATSYVVSSQPVTSNVMATGTSVTFGGLRNGTSYTFTVKGVNSAGTGSASSPSNAVTPRKRYRAL